MSEAPHPDRPPRQRWFVLALVFAGTFFCYAHRNALSIAAPSLGRDFGLSPAALGVLLSVFFWTYAAAQVPSGWLVDRYGVGRVYAAGFVVWAGAAAATGQASSFAGLLLLRLVMGMGQGVVFPANARTVANWFPAKERGGATAVYLSGTRVGQAVTIAIGAGYLASHGWRSFFAWTAGAGILWLVPWLVFHWRYERTPLSPEVRVTGTASVAALGRLLRDRRMVGILLAFFAADYLWLLSATWIPGYFVTVRRFTPAEMRLYISLPYLLTMATTVLAGIAGDAAVRLGRSEIGARRRLAIAGLLLACIIAPVGWVHDPHLAGLLAAAAIIAQSIAIPNIWALTQVVAGRERAGMGAGLQNLAGNIGGILAPLVTGVVAQATGSFTIAFVIAAGVLLVGATAAWALIREEPAALRPIAHGPSTMSL